MPICFDPWLTGLYALDAFGAARAGAPDLPIKRRQRLAELLRSAANAPVYRERLQAARPGELDSIAPIGKRELMADFDHWVTDPRVRLSDLRRFLKDTSAIGQAFAGGYVVWESSGSSGEPAVFVQDARAMAVYDALEACRRPVHWADPWCLGERMVFIGATGGHFASNVTVERLRRLNPALGRRLHSVSIMQTAAQVVEQLHAFDPTVISTYPTVAVLLAAEAQTGRLRVRPREIWTGGETLSAGMCRNIERHLGAKVLNSYGASEFLPLATPCRLGAMHVNTDWAILESVDEHYRPVPPGVTGHTTLLTNLANHVQPILRYDLGDRVCLRAQPCACGSSLPVVEVEGRCDDLLVMRSSAGEAVRLPPLALTTVLEEDGGIYDFQLVQLGPRSLRLGLGVGVAADEGSRSQAALRAYLRVQGLQGVRVSLAPGAARVRGRTGKSQRVVGCGDVPDGADD